MTWHYKHSVLIAKHDPSRVGMECNWLHLFGAIQVRKRCDGHWIVSSFCISDPEYPLLLKTRLDGFRRLFIAVTVLYRLGGRGSIWKDLLAEVVEDKQRVLTDRRWRAKQQISGKCCKFVFYFIWFQETIVVIVGPDWLNVGKRQGTFNLDGIEGDGTVVIGEFSLDVLHDHPLLFVRRKTCLFRQPVREIQSSVDYRNFIVSDPVQCVGKQRLLLGPISLIFNISVCVFVHSALSLLCLRNFLIAPVATLSFLNRPSRLLLR